MSAHRATASPLPSPSPRALACVGLVAAAGTAAIAVIGAGDWGLPGSPAYGAYELANRLAAFALAAMVAAPAGLWLALASRRRTRVTRMALLVVAGALAGMAIGSAAEFWLFTEQPYRGAGSEGRNAAWATFLLSAATLLATSVVVGIGLLRGRLVPVALGLAVILAGPAGAVLTALGTQFLGVPLIGLAMSAATLSAGRAVPGNGRPTR